MSAAEVRRAVLLAVFLILLSPHRVQAQDTAAPLTRRPGDSDQPLWLNHPETGQMGPGPQGVDPPRRLARPLPTPREHDRIVYAFKVPARSLMTYAADLSTACRRGRFLQRTDMAYRAFGPGERPLGVAYGTMAINLIDPDRHREAGIVYFFDKQDTGRCAVYTARQDALTQWFVGP